MKRLFQITALMLGFLAACSTPQHDGAHHHGDMQHQLEHLTIGDLESHHFEAKPWSSLEILDGPERFQFLVVTDRTGGHREGIFREALDKIDLLQPSFVMSVGDYIEGYRFKREGETIAGRFVAYTEKELKDEWDDFEAMIEGMDAPFFYTPGNHDFEAGLPGVDTDYLRSEWRERFGRSFYHFIYKDVLFLVLNTELFDQAGAPWTQNEAFGGEPWVQRYAELQADQMVYVEAVLAQNEDVRWTFVFAHQPFWRERWKHPGKGKEQETPVEGPWDTDGFTPKDWRRVESLLSDRDYTIFAGHWHWYNYQGANENGHTHDKIAMATTGGGSRLRGLEYGEFDHMIWVTMTEDGPAVANLLLDGVHGKEIETPKARPAWIKGE